MGCIPADWSHLAARSAASFAFLWGMGFLLDINEHSNSNRLLTIRVSWQLCDRHQNIPEVTYEDKLLD